MLVRNFLFWHYVLANKFILRLIVNFIGFAFHLFSVRFLIKSLFAPWRRIEMVNKAPGFSLVEWWHRFSFNLISRIIGFFVRSLLVFLGLVLALFFLLLGLLVLLAWQFLPLFSWAFFYLQQTSAVSLKKQKKQKEFVYQRLAVANDQELEKLPPEDVKLVLAWWEKIEAKKKQKKQFWRPENLYKAPSLGNSLAFGFTLNLDKYCLDLSLPQPFSHQLVGRKKEVDQIQTVLIRKGQRGVILVGSAGVGKQTIILGLAKAIKEKQVYPSLFYHRILGLNMGALLGASPVLEEVKAKFSRLLKEAAKAGNVILVINQMEKYFSNFQGIDLTSVLTHFLQSNQLLMIGTTTPSSYEKFIFSNAPLMKYFEKVEVSPPSAKEALNILMQILPDFEKDAGVIVTFPALKEIILLADKLVTNIPFPEKAIDFLDQIIVQAKRKRQKVINKTDVDQLFSAKTKVPLGSLSQEEKTRLKNFAFVLHQRVVDQNQAIEAITKAVQRARLGIKEGGRPIGSFLFLGPTGVGKTETAKAVAQAFFGSSKKIMRLDMSQFQNDLAVADLIGSSFAVNPGQLVKMARENPYGVLLLDEFEKANPRILNLFLPVLDEGYLKDNQGRIVSFKNMIIICTSNAAAEFVREKIKTIRLLDRSARQTNSGGLKKGNQAGLNQPAFNQLTKEVIEYVLQKRIFSPELINRFDQVIVFEPLKPEDIKKISAMMLEKLKQRLAKKGIFLELSSEAVDLAAKLGYSLEFGARPMKRLIADKVESLIAKGILNNEIKTQDRIKLVVDGQSKTFKIEKYG